ncbi:hypothetical protein [Pseudotenacibaculum haliotis]|uniref:Lipoprotein n=1 Tax=Pseudotenacibaculum haliotis TaxID=1862138 RepID=A0ABW5LPV8_9FLAO
MKKLAIILIVLFIGCDKHNPKTQYLSTIIDLSEEGSYKPTSKEILSYLKKGHHSDGIEISLRYVSETRYAPKYQFVLQQGEVGWLSNEDTQRRKKRLLLKQFKDTLQSTLESQQPLQRSEIFRLVVDELEHLSKQKGKRTLLLVSDIKEHSSLFSMYDKGQLQKLLREPMTLVELFQDHVVIPENLSGITLHILYRPKPEEDLGFTAMVALYRSLFESRGATVKVSQVHIITL